MKDALQMIHPVMYTLMTRRLRAALLLLVVLPASSAVAQTRTVTGYVEDESSGERIMGAAVYIPEWNIGVTSNQYGFYSLTIPVAATHLTVSHVAYEQASYAWPLRADTTFILTLTRRIIDLEEIEVTAEDASTVEQTQMSLHELPVEEIETLPVLLGEVDIQKTLQLLPGVQGGLEGSSGLYVRGGRSDQNLFLLDGLPLYNPSHVLGFFSVFNTDAMKRVEFVKGAFPARYGGRLSSVVNFTMKEGNLKRFSGHGAIGLLSSRAMLEGPIIKDRASFLVAGRRTFIDPVLRIAQRMFQDPAKPVQRVSWHFYDLNVKANVIASRRDRVYVSGYLSQDGFSYNEHNPPVLNDADSLAFDLRWRNRLASLRWNRLIGDRLFVNVIVGVTNYQFLAKTLSSEADGEAVSRYRHSWLSEIVDYTARADFDWAWTPQHYIRFGAEGVVHRFKPGATQTILEDSGVRTRTFLQSPTGTLPSHELTFYVEDNIQLQPGVTIAAGIRLTRYAARTRSYNSIEPRLSAHIRLAESTAANLSAVRLQQYVHLLSSGSSALPVDLWIPSMDDIPPQQGQHFAAGLVHSLGRNLYRLSLEGYLKRMKGYIDYTSDANFLRSAVLEWPDLLDTGRGTAYGLEFFARKRRGRLTGWLGYTWAQATRQFETLNRGHPFPDKYDRRHDISLVLQFRISAATHVSATWVYGSGYPIWAPAGHYRMRTGFLLDLDPYLVDFGPVNSARAPAYHRLDLNVQLRKKKSWGERTISMGIYNAYNRKNPLHVYPSYDASRRTFSFRQISVLQLVPALSCQWRF